jgi:hypothetical protein
MSSWNDRKIVDDPRIAHTDPAVRTAAELLHRMESLHLHVDIEDKVCVYCALRASHVLSTVGERLRAADSDGAAQAVARALDEHKRHGGSIPWPTIQRPVEEWRRLQDTELGERLRDQTAGPVDTAWGTVDV